ncbi:MAG: glycerol-3-phosphate acyltransferase [Dehalococcoidales bacterium]|nr:MAG: glycerol-3-phosphate acyltransferase [Dehalococcoidales bacterium]
MVVNEFVSGSIAVVIAYLLGAIPAAYIITRIFSGKDIRQVGGGNVGARNVFQEVGWVAGVATGVFDIGKGAAAVFIAIKILGVPAWWFADVPAEWLSSVPTYFVLASALAVVVGHIWPVYLKFRGGRGLSPAIGVLAILMTRELLLAFALTIVILFFIRNPILSVNISLLTVPLTGWYMEKSWLLVIFTVVLLLVMVLHFVPTARAALKKAGSWDNLIDELLRREKPKKTKQKVVK